MEIDQRKFDEALSGKDSTKLRRDMKKGVVDFSYRKKSTGEIRHAKGTLKKSELPKFAEDRPAKPNAKNFVYWDTEKDQFRCFARDNFIGVDTGKGKKQEKEMTESDYIQYVAHMLDECGPDRMAANDRLVKFNGSFDDVIFESDTGSNTFVYDIPIKQFRLFLQKSPVTNRLFKTEASYRKFIDGDRDFDIGRYAICCLFGRGLHNKNEIKSYACVSVGVPTQHTYIECCQALQNGFGKPLVVDLIRAYDKVWLFADYRGGEKLLAYYRQPAFGFLEQKFVGKGDVTNTVQHMFCSENADIRRIANIACMKYNLIPRN